MTFEEDMELYRVMHARYDQLAGPVREEVARTFYNIRRNNKPNNWGTSMEQALMVHGLLPPKPPVPVTDAGAIEYEEIMEGDKIMREQG